MSHQETLQLRRSILTVSAWMLDPTNKTPYLIQVVPGADEADLADSYPHLIYFYGELETNNTEEVS